MAGVKRRMYSDSDIHAFHKELEEVSCPICMDHPHNAVLLLCSSHDKGCRSYICDTSYRHSNCLDRFKKLRASSRNSTTLPHSSPLNPQNSSNTSDMNLALRTDFVESNENHNLNGSNSSSVGLPEGPGENSLRQIDRQLEREGEGNLNPEAGDSLSFHERNEIEDLDVDNLSESSLNLKCPMCRGAVVGWEVVEEARKYLNLKRRTCSRESCSFVGNYQELRRHARSVHPTTRPSDIDPFRERAWQRLEHQREYSDIVSALRSSMPGAVVVGDYVIENGDRFSAGREIGSGEVNAPWRTFFLFHMIGSMDGAGESRARSRAWTRHRRSAGALAERRRFLWGENLLGLQDDDEDEDEEDDEDDDDDLHIFSDVGEDTSPIPRRRRRFTQSRSDEDQP